MTSEQGHKKDNKHLNFFKLYKRKQNNVVSTQLIDNNCIVNPGSQLPFFFNLVTHARTRTRTHFHILRYVFIYFFILFIYFFFTCHAHNLCYIIST